MVHIREVGSSSLSAPIIVLTAVSVVRLQKSETPQPFTDLGRLSPGR
jgi:hypothetical protein